MPNQLKEDKETLTKRKLNQRRVKSENKIKKLENGTKIIEKQSFVSLINDHEKPIHKIIIP